MLFRFIKKLQKREYTRLIYNDVTAIKVMFYIVFVLILTFFLFGDGGRNCFIFG